MRTFRAELWSNHGMKNVSIVGPQCFKFSTTSYILKQKYCVTFFVLFRVHPVQQEVEQESLDFKDKDAPLNH